MLAKKRAFPISLERSQRIPHTEPVDSSGESQGDDWCEFVGVKDNPNSAVKEAGLGGLARFTFKGR